jgi:Protein of unknown function (DUF1501)
MDPDFFGECSMALLHPRTSRRRFLGASLASTLGLAFSPAFRNLFAAERATAKACIVLWLEGGPSHLDTFDPKPGAETGGPFKAIATKTPGLQLCEHLPRLGNLTNHLAVVRSITSKEADHERANYYLHTGNMPEESMMHPGLGSVLSREGVGKGSDLPLYIVLSGSGAGPGYFGVDHAPFIAASLDDPIANLALHGDVDEARLKRRVAVLESLDGGFGRQVDRTQAATQKRLTERALQLRKSPAVKAFDLAGEKPALLEAYGIKKKKEGEEADPRDILGRSLLVARRLVEQGVRCVEATLDGWDTHENNFAQVKNLCGTLDHCLPALLTDLADRGLLSETLVVCMGEFGRTPRINQAQGRDHYSQVFSLALAGGGVRGGQVIGASDATGEQVKEQPVAIPDLHATLLTACGIDINRTHRTPEGRPVKLAEKGKVIKGLLE